GRVHVTATPVLGRGTDFSVTITNVSNEKIPGPILLVFTSLPPGVALASVSGHTVAGDPFVAVSLTGLAPGQSAQAMVRFTAPPSHGPVVEVLAGLPQKLLPPPHLDPITAALPLPGAVLPSSPSVLDFLFADGDPAQRASRTGLSVP